jgi:hypothetical protein
MSKKTWNNPPTLVKLPERFKDILTLTAIALDRGLISENQLRQFIESALSGDRSAK